MTDRQTDWLCMVILELEKRIAVADSQILNKLACQALAEDRERSQTPCSSVHDSVTADTPMQLAYTQLRSRQSVRR